MRNLVQPPASLHCESCDGELRFKRIESDDPVFDREVEIFVCVKCGRVHSLRMIHDPFAAHIASSMRHSAVGHPAGSGSNRYA